MDGWCGDDSVTEGCQRRVTRQHEIGFDGVPEAGEIVRVVENERRARQLAGERANRLKTEALARRSGRKVSWTI